MAFIIARKLNMTQVFTEEGTAVPVTVLKVPTCTVSQVKTKDKEGYDAVQLKCENVSREFRVTDTSEYKTGQEVTVASFAPGQLVHVSGITKGRGFAGVMKRHGFHGAPASHGHPHQRTPGSIGQMFPQHVRKGMRMAGHMGNVYATEKSLHIVAVDEKEGLLFVKGSVPGARNGLLQVQASGVEKEAKKVASLNMEEKKQDNQKTEGNEQKDEKDDQVQAQADEVEDAQSVKEEAKEEKTDDDSTTPDKPEEAGTTASSTQEK